MEEFKGKKIRTKLENSLYNEKHLLKYFKNKEDAKYFSRGSERYIECICPLCGLEKEIRAHNLFNHGFSCPYCSKGMSYPERFLHEYLRVKKIEFEYQHKLEGMNRYLDFYISKMNIAIESHGEQHYNGGMFKKHTKHNTLKSDEIKRKYCKDKGIKLIELDCSKSNFMYIKKSIDNTILPSIEKEDIDLIKKGIISSTNKRESSIIKDIKKGITYHKISKKYNVDPKHVFNIAKRYHIHDKCFKDGRTKKVYCNETKTTYISTSKAEEELDIKKGNVYRVANGSRNYCKNNQGVKFTFKYI